MVAYSGTAYGAALMHHSISDAGLLGGGSGIPPQECARLRGVWP